jgi:hypothetical protein
MFDHAADQMNTPGTTILVVAPYTKRFGIAVFCDAELLYYGVKTLARPRTLESIRSEVITRLNRLIDEFSPELVVIKHLSQRQARSEKQKQVGIEIRRIARENGIASKHVQLDEVNKKLSTDGRPTMAQTFSTLLTVYPELARFSLIRNRSQREYYSAVISAVAVGFIHQHG